MKKKKFKIIKLRPKQDYSYKRKVLITDLTLLMSIGIHNFEMTNAMLDLFINACKTFDWTICPTTDA